MNNCFSYDLVPSQRGESAGNAFGTPAGVKMVVAEKLVRSAGADMVARKSEIGGAGDVRMQEGVLAMGRQAADTQAGRIKDNLLTMLSPTSP